jgi:hypothetical protein
MANRPNKVGDAPLETSGSAVLREEMTKAMGVRVDNDVVGSPTAQVK